MHITHHVLFLSHVSAVTRDINWYAKVCPSEQCCCCVCTYREIFCATWFFERGRRYKIPTVTPPARGV